MKQTKLTTLIMGLALMFLVTLSSAILAHENKATAADSAGFIGMDLEPAKVIHQFHQALQAGNEVLVKEVLADDVLIYEGGNVERSLAEYVSHHMAADMAYLANLTITHKEHQIRVIGNVAVSTAITNSVGMYKDKEIDSLGMETLVLVKQSDGNWKITHVHWS